jgi:hypothetical protein
MVNQFQIYGKIKLYIYLVEFICMYKQIFIGMNQNL